MYFKEPVSLGFPYSPLLSRHCVFFPSDHKASVFACNSLSTAENVIIYIFKLKKKAKFPEHRNVSVVNGLVDLLFNLFFTLTCDWVSGISYMSLFPTKFSLS